MASREGIKARVCFNTYISPEKPDGSVVPFVWRVGKAQKPECASLCTVFVLACLLSSTGAYGVSLTIYNLFLEDCLSLLHSSPIFTRKGLPFLASSLLLQMQSRVFLSVLANSEKHGLGVKDVDGELPA